jgi:uncharacterized protein (DUF488 family)
MSVSGRIKSRRLNNANGLAAFGISASDDNGDSICKVVREGNSVTIFTVGYEKRSGEDLIAVLRDCGVEYLADVRDNPVSRKPDFRKAALRAICEDAGIEYGPWSELGSTEGQRERLRESGDLAHFHKTFRAYARRSLSDSIDRLAAVAKRKSVALLCYERAHDECHRRTVANLLADRLDAGIAAIL